ncbi:hypothetical protein [Pseudomonas sp. 2FG]|uniref:hypothetical protein n=1 Tax=Pseudomonas sp. 2FG TaxID=2502191 RepID=UPI002114AD4A|nr:hypothetical protein [Pseudomonas sp. 2FG]
MPILGRTVQLSVALRRVACRTCGQRKELVSWLDRYARLTRHLAEAVLSGTSACRPGRSCVCTGIPYDYC